MKQVVCSLSFLFLGAFPGISLAQLSSTNYQVDVEYVGEEGGGYATSTSYQLDGVTGTPYEYDGTVSAPTTSPSDGGTTGSRTRTGTTTATQGTESPDNPSTGSEYTPVSSSGSGGADSSDFNRGGNEDPAETKSGEIPLKQIPAEVAKEIAQKGMTFVDSLLDRPVLLGMFFILLLILIVLFVRYVRSLRSGGTSLPN